MMWRSVAAYPDCQNRGAIAQERLTQAYRDVFCRKDESTEIVLADLANYCGFYKVPPIGSPPETLLVDQGLRAAFGRLFSFLAMTDDQLAALEGAARREAIADSEKGLI
jgi:hypothetical protein